MISVLFSIPSAAVDEKIYSTQAMSDLSLGTSVDPSIVLI